MPGLELSAPASAVVAAPRAALASPPWRDRARATVWAGVGCGAGLPEGGVGAASWLSVGDDPDPDAPESDELGPAPPASLPPVEDAAPDGPGVPGPPDGPAVPEPPPGIAPLAALAEAIF